MAGADKLYTPELLALAVSLADYPASPALPLHGQARSKSCGSTLAADLAVDESGRIERLGLQVRACAVCRPRRRSSPAPHPATASPISSPLNAALVSWLAGVSSLPDWPGLEAIAPARDFPARHGAIMLPWTAARDALSSASADR